MPLEQKVLTGAIIVKFKTEAAKDSCFEKYGFSELYPMALTWSDWMYWIRLPKEIEINSLVDQLSSEEGVEWAEAEWSERIGPRS